MQKKVKPFGTWQSPIIADTVVSGGVGLSEVKLDGNDVYWIESRQNEGGRNVIVKMSVDDIHSEVIPREYNARTRVHEYGGGSYLVNRGVVYFTNYADQRMYRQCDGAAPVAITPSKKYRYACGVFGQLHNRIIIVREDHSKSTQQPLNAIVAVNPDEENEGDIIVSGEDFYSSPAINPFGTQLAWLSWNHPLMPWDGTSLWVATFKADGSIKNARKIAGGEHESIFQPRWDPDGTLYFVSDKTGWWNIYRYKNNVVEAVCPIQSEFGVPQWVFGLSTYDFASDDRIVCAFTRNGVWKLGFIYANNQRLEFINVPYTELFSICAIKNEVYFVSGMPRRHSALIRLRLGTLETKVIKNASKQSISEGYVSAPEEIKFPTSQGDTAYAFYYPPQNKEYEPPKDEKPPLIVKSHGGPTSAARTSLSLETQFWTSRGFAVVDVNYRGSSGYGRPYREALNGNWGEYDVDDCINAARFLVKKGLADESRLIIKGGSAGGFTTLCALTFHAVFKAGANYYGVSDLELLAKDTHKFESHYLDTLIGQYPQARDMYRKRSPINFVEQLSCPLIIFQGLDDKVVPPNQSELIYNALKEKKIMVSYITFADEQHGFRKAENIKKCLEAELAFYAKVFDMAVS